MRLKLLVELRLSLPPPENAPHTSPLNRLGCSGHGTHQRFPFRLLLEKLLFAGGSQPVIPGAAVRLRDVPLRRQPAAPLQTVKRRIERTVLHLDGILRAGPNRLTDPVPVLRTPEQRLKDH